MSQAYFLLFWGLWAITKQYNYVLAKVQRSHAAEKIAVGLVENNESVV